MKDSETRLFILNPGSATEPVHGRLINVTLGHAPRYDGLSYASGNPADMESILVNATSMFVKHNLESALRHLRNQDLPRILWIDEIDTEANAVETWGLNLSFVRGLVLRI